jgi:hypothetical protein
MGSPVLTCKTPSTKILILDNHDALFLVRAETIIGKSEVIGMNHDAFALG